MGEKLQGKIEDLLKAWTLYALVESTWLIGVAAWEQHTQTRLEVDGTAGVVTATLLQAIPQEQYTWAGHHDLPRRTVNVACHHLKMNVF